MSESLPKSAGPTASTDDSPYRIVMVCQGNICRSPLAEQLTRSRLIEAGLHGAVSVSSAGLGAVVGSPMDAAAAAESRRYRGEPEGFRARQLRSVIVAGADLVLTMTKQQRDDVVHRYPRALQRTFTLTEFSKLLALDSFEVVELVDGLVDELSATDRRRVAAGLSERSPQIAGMLRERTRTFSRMRSRARLVPGDDVADPFRLAPSVHEEAAQKISLATSQIVHDFVGWAVDSEGIDQLRA